MRSMHRGLGTSLPVSIGVDLELGLLVAELHLIVLQIAVIWGRVDDHCAALINSKEVSLLDAIKDLLLLAWIDTLIAREVVVEIISSYIRWLWSSTAMMLRLQHVLLGCS
jgi:hypothetical protein